MKPTIVAALLGILLSSCVRPWVGRSEAQLQKELGRPRSIQADGPNRIYVYPDPLAPRSEMTFVVDSKGIIRSWTATTNVVGPFGNDPFGVNDPANVIFPTNP